MAGVKAIAPMLLGVFPFGIVAGAVATDAGLTPWEALAMSVIIYAGSSQLAALQLYASGAPLVIVVAAVGLVNLRLLMYSAAVAPYLRNLRPVFKLLAGYMLTDQTFSYTVSRFNNRSGTPISAGFYLGTAIPMWLVWQAGTVVGAVFGAQVPASGLVGFIVPVVFITLLIPAVTDTASLAAALASGVVTVLGANLPLGLGLMVAAVAGIMAGMLVEGRKR